MGTCDGVDFCLYASVLDVVLCADVVLSASIMVSVTLSTFVCMLRCWMWYPVPILF